VTFFQILDTDIEWRAGFSVAVGFSFAFSFIGGNLYRVPFSSIDGDLLSNSKKFLIPGNVSVLLENGDTKDDLNLPQDGGQPDEVAKEIMTMLDAGDSIMVTVFPPPRPTLSPMGGLDEAL